LLLPDISPRLHLASVSERPVRGLLGAKRTCQWQANVAKDRGHWYGWQQSISSYGPGETTAYLGFDTGFIWKSVQRYLPA
jgi:hypothetical protein